ncbi:hypothetical protein LZ554_003688 [Drepanopeziza brunnea f. sp. 'monogermtubi']|nr:hypothetical protein LZ554_003688 [Drepanopeziza brunnea f. sp. 'monogermtubi']
MQLKHLLPGALAAVAAAKSLTEVLAEQNSTLSSLNALLATQPNLVSTLGSASNITILAPGNEALDAFLKSPEGASAATRPDLVAALLTYHVLNGTYPASAFTSTSQFLPTLLTNSSFANVTGGQVVDARLRGDTASIFSGLLSDSNVTTADIDFDGGVIHVINGLLTIPLSASETATTLELTSLATALTATNLVSTVDALADVTIFAPSNEAFSAVTGNLSTQALSSILTYHVVQGTVGYSSLLSNTTLPTVNGADVTITVVDGAVFVNSARVTIPDVLIAGGVVHVIDSVLNPSNTSVVLSPVPSPTNPTSTVTGGAGSMQAGALGMGLLLGAAAAAALLGNL